ncbi:MAG: hypothetical protein MRZ79_09675 [Bacteroidia bacterium]|nr:hypothetical protein [Bacteroidia bacterium]
MKIFLLPFVFAVCLPSAGTVELKISAADQNLSDRINITLTEQANVLEEVGDIIVSVLADGTFRWKEGKKRERKFKKIEDIKNRITIALEDSKKDKNTIVLAVDKEVDFEPISDLISFIAKLDGKVVIQTQKN